eukprot:Tamp_08295.p1 GENE.Tamp_08295~~Tamp_08295.p1  ORF type:complete len:739 (-),score=125.09 Tamp_08295:131-2116(-)
MVFDVSMWNLTEDNHLVLVKGVGSKAGNTMNESDNKGRLFTQNSDGTLSPTRAPHLVLGATLPAAVGAAGGGAAGVEPSRDASLNADLNDTARNTNDIDKIRRLVRDSNADLLSTNGEPWNHTPLHQSAYHGRLENCRVLVELLREKGVLLECLDKSSNPCGRGARGTPVELARGGGHHAIASFLESAGASKTDTGEGRDYGVILDGEDVEEELTFSHVQNDTFDQRGLLYMIGTQFGKEAYTNPADSGRVSLGWSSDAANFYSTQGGHKVGDARQAASVICANAHPGHNATMWSKGKAGAWFVIDLLAVTLKPTHFAYRNDYGGGGNHPRIFELQGSTDGVEWTTLAKHSNETWKGKEAKHWAIEGCEIFYSQFRILNQGSPNHLCCSGIELYGAVSGTTKATKATKATNASGRQDKPGRLVQLRIGHALTWKEARQQADREAGGLPTCDELRKAGVSAGNGVDLWMPVQRADGREGDYCQIGNHPMNKTRYISHIDTFGDPSWYKNTKSAGWRPGPSSSACKGIFYARAASRGGRGGDPLQVNTMGDMGAVGMYDTPSAIIWCPVYGHPEFDQGAYHEPLGCCFRTKHRDGHTSYSEDVCEGTLCLPITTALYVGTLAYQPCGILCAGRFPWLGDCPCTEQRVTPHFVRKYPHLVRQPR